MTKCKHCDEEIKAPKPGFKNAKYYCDEECQEEYWGKGLREKGIKPSHSIEEIQARLLKMGKEAKKHPFEHEMEELHEDKDDKVIQELFKDF